jgi:hypothetical protein
VLSPAAAGAGPAAAAAAAAASKQTASKAPPPPPPLPPPAAFNSSSTNSTTAAGAAAAAAELQLDAGVNVGPKAPPAAPGFNSAGLARSSSIAPISRVPGLVLHFQQLRQSELAKQYNHVAAAGSTSAARSPVKGRGGAADWAPAADTSQLLNEVRELGGAPLLTEQAVAHAARVLLFVLPETSYTRVQRHVHCEVSWPSSTIMWLLLAVQLLLGALSKAEVGQRMGRQQLLILHSCSTK